MKEKENREKSGRLLNKAGKGNYTNADAPEKLIRYITRTNGMPDDDLIAWGGIGIAEYRGMDEIIGQFQDVQRRYARKGPFGRYMDHEIFSLSSECGNLVLENRLDIDRIVRKMAYDIYNGDRCQVVYGIHMPSSEDRHLHVHFAVNTVNFETKKKRRENMRETKERENRFIKILEDEISQQLTGR